MPTITHDFSPGDEVFIISELLQSINRGTCQQVEAELHNGADDTLVTTIRYLILVEHDGGTKWVSEDNIFSTYAAAATELGTRFEPPV